MSVDVEVVAPYQHVGAAYPLAQPWDGTGREGDARNRVHRIDGGKLFGQGRQAAGGGIQYRPRAHGGDDQLVGSVVYFIPSVPQMFELRGPRADVHLVAGRGQILDTKGHAGEYPRLPFREKPLIAKTEGRGVVSGRLLKPVRQRAETYLAVGPRFAVTGLNA